VFRLKVPNKIRTYCPRCKTHTTHTTSLYKAGRRRGARKGERRQKRRKKGYGGQKFPEQHNQAKTTKKQTLILACDECDHKMHRKGIRMNRLEIQS
jgi:large subunit ribosomal protein L44e